MRVNPTRQHILKTFSHFKNDPAFAESAELLANGGLPVEMIQAMSLRPEVLQLLAAFGKGTYPGGILPRRLKELVILQASILHACQFCTDSHVSMIRQLNISDQPKELLSHPEKLSQREQLALSYTKSAVTDSNNIPETLFTKLKKAFSNPEIVELTAVIGMITMLNLFNNCLQVAYQGEYEKKRLASQDLLLQS